MDSPFIAGGRFDRDRSVCRAVRVALGQHVLLSDSHQFRKGCERIIERCTSEAERVLLPHYLAQFQQSKEALQALVAFLYGGEPIRQGEEVLRGFDFTIGEMDCDMAKFGSFFNQSRHRAADFLREVVDSKPDYFQRLRANRSISLASLA